MAIDNETPTLAQVIKSAIEARLLNVHTSLPGRVESYSAATQKANIKPLLTRTTVDGEKIEIPILQNVPVKWPRTANAIISLPLAAGDTGTILFHERSLDQWLLKGGITDPLDTRKHSYSDAEFIPGLYPFSQPGFAEDTNILIKNGLAELRLAPTGKFGISNAAADLIDEIIKLVDETKNIADASALITVTTVVGVSSVPLNATSFVSTSALLALIKVALQTLKL